MKSEQVGASILNIITESLYDSPIVVFREYVQNSIDSFLRNDRHETVKEINIIYEDETLFFLDTGDGIAPSSFLEEMRKIGSSKKIKTRNLGYKGIGRLSGVPYCERLTFINIYNRNMEDVQSYEIDGKKYASIKESSEYTNMGFGELMERISTYAEKKDVETVLEGANCIKKYNINIEQLGFVVILKNVKKVLTDVISDESFMEKLQWLLPIGFKKELYNMKPEGELFDELSTKGENDLIPARAFDIFYNGERLKRPINRESLRDYICKLDLKYAYGFHSFSKGKIMIDRSNSFSGIRLYIDNMLLCDENELLSNLERYGYLDHTLNGQLQSTKGIGALIYITDKVSISTNARRTFIEVNNDESIDFLKLIAEFVNRIYEARYALSNYVSAKEKMDENNERLKLLKKDAIQKLQNLANEKVELYDENDVADELDDLTKKRISKKRITSRINLLIKEFLRTQEINIDNVYDEFKRWFIKNEVKNVEK